MQESHAAGRFFLRTALLLGLLFAVNAAAPLLSELKGYPIEVPIGVAFLATWGFLIAFFENILFGIPYPNIFR